MRNVAFTLVEMAAISRGLNVQLTWNTMTYSLRIDSTPV